MLADLLNELVLMQLVGMENFGYISQGIRQQLKDNLNQAGTEAILPALRSASDLDALDSAMRMFFEWAGVISNIVENDPELSLVVKQVGNVTGEKSPRFLGA